MKNKSKYNKWVEEAYVEFAENGPAFSLKALSEKTGLPRATFYYHFLNKEDLISAILKSHQTINDEFQNEIRSIKKLIPDLYTMLFQHKISLMFHQQLLKNSHIDKYRELYYSSNNDSIRNLLPHIRSYFGFDYSDDDIFNFYNTLTDVWYTRLDFSNLSVEHMIDLAEEIMKDILKLSNHTPP